MNYKLFFILIIIIAGILRIVALDKYPAGFNADEASIGYNAYSLLQTGRDEYGTSWPLSFKSFGDFKPGLYFYMVMPFVATLGLSEWAVRLPSALLGIGTVILVYFLAKEIFLNKWVGVLSALLLAISPWHLHFSRGGWETNAATFLITLGILLFLKGMKNGSFWGWSGIAFVLSMYTYQSPRLIVPILLFCLTFLYRFSISSILRIIGVKKVGVAVALLLIFLTPLIWQFFSGTGSSRFSGLSFLSDSGPATRVNELRGEHQNPGGIIPQLIHNKLTAYGPNFLGHYLDHFKSDFLFINGDPIIRDKVPEAGQFYLIEALFLIVGIVALTKKAFVHTKLLVSWILIAPLASSLTFQTPHAVRALNLVVPMSMVMGFGLWVMGGWFKSRWRLLGISLISLILVFESVHYLESYYLHYPKRYPQAFEYGFKEMVGKLNKIEGQYNQIIITDRYDQPYILLLFYKQYDPRLYQPQAVLSPRDKFNFGTVKGFDKYQFRNFSPEEVSSSKETLFIGVADQMPINAKIIDKVNFPNGQNAFLFARKRNINEQD